MLSFILANNIINDIQKKNIRTTAALEADGDKVSPIEVRSSGYKTHASLDTFCNNE